MAVFWEETSAEDVSQHGSRVPAFTTILWGNVNRTENLSVDKKILSVEHSGPLQMAMFW